MTSDEVLDEFREAGALLEGHFVSRLLRENIDTGVDRF